MHSGLGVIIIILLYSGKLFEDSIFRIIAQYVMGMIACINKMKRLPLIEN